MTMDARADSLPASNLDPAIHEHGLSPTAERTVSWGTSGLLHAGVFLLAVAVAYAAGTVLPKGDGLPLVIPTAIDDTQRPDAMLSNAERYTGPNDNPYLKFGDELLKNRDEGMHRNGLPDAANLFTVGSAGGPDVVGEICATFGGSLSPGTGGDGLGAGRLMGNGSPKGGYLGPATRPPGGRMATKVVFVLDHSGSMLDTFDFLRQEVRRVVGRFTPMQHFGVVMFSEGVTVLGPDRLQRALPETRIEVLNRLDQVRAQGENDELLEPFQVAIQKALAMQPEVVIFLTDGKFDERLPGAVKAMNKPTATGRKAVINTIAFVKIDPAAEVGLQQIARDSGGRYKFVGDNELGK